MTYSICCQNLCTNYCSPQDAWLKAEPQTPKPLGIALHGALTLVKHPLALKPKPQLLTQNTQTWGSRLVQCMS